MPFDSPMSSGPLREIVIVDWTVSDHQTLTSGINPGTPIILLERGQSGLAALAEILAQYQNLDTIHLVTHGWGGALQLGGELVTKATLATQIQEIQAISAALKSGGDLLLYGCSVAAGEAGQTFLSALSATLGDVDIAASTNKTGPARLGGDWDLEWSKGEINSVLPFTMAGMQEIGHCLGCDYDPDFMIFTVNGDTVAYAPGTDPAFTYNGPGGKQVGLTYQQVLDLPVCQDAGPNTAPSLVGASFSITAIPEDSSVPSGTIGTLVSGFLNLGTTVTDPDPSAAVGMAVTGTVSTNGAWYYWLDGEEIWKEINPVSDSSALLLRSNDRLYFVPNENYFGTVNDGLTFRAWDRTGGDYAGQKVDTATTGGITAFSTNTATLSVTITAVNDPPILTSGGALSAIAEDAANPGGSALSALGIVASDPLDNGTITGYLIIGNTADTATQGAWEYSTNGSNWYPIGTVNDGASALALSASTLIRFKPVTDYNGTPGHLVIRAVDNGYSGTWSTAASSESRVVVNATTIISDNAASATTATITTSITAVNDAPVISNLDGDALVFRDGDPATLLDQATAANTSDVDHSNFQGGNLTVSLTGGTRLDGVDEVLSINSGPLVSLSSGLNVGSQITIGGNVIGSIATSGTGSGSEPLIVVLTAFATPTTVATLIRNITYQNSAAEPVAGSRTIQFVLTDSAGGAVSEPATVTVEVNSKPVITTLPIDISFTDTAAADDFSTQTGLSGSIAASDANADVLAYGIQGASVADHTAGGVTYDLARTGSYGTLYLDSTTGQYLFEPDNEAINASAIDGDENYTFTVTESGLAYPPVTHDLTVGVAGVNDNPVSLMLSAGMVSVFDTAQAIVGTLTSTDADGPSASYSITAITTPSGGNGALDGSLFNINSANLRATLPADLETGSYTITIMVEDGSGGSLTRDFTTTVDSALTVTSNSDTGDDATVTGTLAEEMADGGGLSLREALQFAGSGNATIWFGAGLDGQVITLESQADIPAGTVFQTENSFSITGAALSLDDGLTVSNSSGSHLTLASNVIGTGDLHADGDGIVTLSGTGNSLSGTVDVAGGVLNMTGSVVAQDGLTVSAGATLGGTGAISGGTSGLLVAEGGIIKPGVEGISSGVGTLSITGGVTINGTLALTLVNETSHSTLQVDGNLILGTSAGLSVVTDELYTPAVGAKHQLVTLSNGSTVSGTFAAAAEGGVIISSGLTHQLSYAGGDGNDLEITRVLGPSIQSVSALTSDGSYKAGDSISITISLTEAVTVTGIPALALSNGAIATYQDGTGSSTLTFVYQVGTGDDSDDLDYGSSGALTLPVGAAITGIVSDLDAILALPLPGTPGSLGAAKDIVIDTTPPMPPSIGIVALDDVISSPEKSAGVVLSGTMSSDTASISLSIGGNIRNATLDAGSGTWSYNLAEGDFTQIGEGAETISVTAFDAVGNSASASRDITVLTIAQPPSILPAASPLIADSVTFTVTFADEMAGVDATDFTLSSQGTAGGKISDLTDAGQGIYIVTVSDIEGAGTLRLDLKATGTSILDSLGNGLASGVVGGEHTVDRVAPALKTAIVSGNTLLLTYEESLDGTFDPPALAYEVLVQGTQVAVKAVDANGPTVTLTLARSVAFGEAVEVSYLVPNDTPVRDIAGNPAGELISQQVINQAADPSLPTDPTAPVGSIISSSSRTVDGLTVNDLVVRAANGATKSVLEVPAVPADRPAGNPVVIPVVTDAQGQSLLDLHLPSGLGLRVETPPSNATGPADSLVLAFLGSSGASVPPADQAAMRSGWQSFLALQDSQTEFLARTVELTVRAGMTTAPSQPLVISSPPGNAGQMEALVIDARHLPPGTVIQLENVEFAFIIGPTSVTGGTGSQYVVGDSSGQYIVLGADDDCLYGGGGNDVIGSMGGDDRLSGGGGDDVMFGGTGNDTIDGGPGTDVVRFDGNAADFTIVTDTNGTVTVTDRRSHTDPAQSAGSDLLTNVEFLLFADGIRLTSIPPDPMAVFDNVLYLAANPDVAAAVAGGLFRSGLEHFAAFGWAEGRHSILAVDDRFYRDRYTDVNDAIETGDLVSSNQHFVLHGQREGRDPNAFFATDWYLARYNDVATAVEAGITTAYEHYAYFGWREDRDPSAWFDTSEYLRLNPDVAQAGINPLVHLLGFGMHEGRLAPVIDVGL